MKYKSLLFFAIVGIGVVLAGIAAFLVIFHNSSRPTVLAPPGSNVIVFSAADPALGGEQIYATAGRGAPPIRVTHNIHRLIPWLPIGNPFGSMTQNQNPHAASEPGGIIFASTLNGDYELYQIQIDGSNQQRLPIPIDTQANATLSPDGQLLALVRPNGTLVIRQRDGTREHCLTCGQSGSVTSFAWAPTSQALLYSGADHDDQAGIFFTTVEGDQQRRITAASLHAGSPAWSPDATHIAFAAEARVGRGHIFTMRLDGTDMKQLTNAMPEPPNEVAVDDRPVWSPDGTRIAFTSTRHGGTEIYVMQVDGSHQQRLTWSGRNYDPAWVQIPVDL